MRVIVKDPPKTLCVRCAYGNVVTYRSGRTAIQCSAITMVMREPVEECTRYLRHGEASLWDMQQQAWLLDMRPGMKIGFARPGTKTHKALKEVTVLPYSED